VALGAGRNRIEDRIDPAVGILVAAKPGDAVHLGDPVLEIHYRDRTHLDGALALAGRAIAIGDARPAAMPLILGEVH
jgi:pyrimidine-nucleoside phosphorylase